MRCLLWCFPAFPGDKLLLLEIVQMDSFKPQKPQLPLAVPLGKCCMGMHGRVCCGLLQWAAYNALFPLSYEASRMQRYVDSYKSKAIKAVMMQCNNSLLQSKDAPVVSFESHLYLFSHTFECLWHSLGHRQTQSCVMHIDKAPKDIGAMCNLLFAEGKQTTQYRRICRCRGGFLCFSAFFCYHQE